MAAYRPIRHAAGTRPSWPWLAVTLFALAWAVLDLTGSARDLGFVIAAKTAPLVILLLVGGVFADRLPRRGVMLTAEITRMGIQAATAALLLSRTARVWELIVLQAFAGAATAFFNSASTGLTPMTMCGQEARIGRSVISRAGRSEEMVSHLVHFGSHSRQVGFLGGASIGEARDRIGQIHNRPGVKPDPLESAAKQAVGGVCLATGRRFDGRDSILNRAGGSGPSRFVAGVRVASVVEIICCDGAGADVNVYPPEQRHAVKAGEDNPPHRRTGELGIGAKGQHRRALAQGSAQGVGGFGEVLVGHDPADVDVAVLVGGASTERPAELGDRARNPALQRR